VKILTNGLNHYLNISNETLQIFLRIDPAISNPQQNDIRIVDYGFRKISKFLVQSQSQNPALNFRIYLSNLNHQAKIRFVEDTLELDLHTSIPIGFYESYCDTFLAHKSAITTLQKLAFLTCYIPVQFSNDPVEEADKAVETCEGYRQLVVSLNSSAEVMCNSAHSPIQVVHGQEIGSAKNFEAFWCRIASRLKSNRTLSRFIMFKVFDIKHKYVYNESSVVNVGGLWRRKHGSSYESDTFVDVTEEFSTKSMNMTQKEVKSNFLSLHGTDWFLLKILKFKSLI